MKVYNNTKINLLIASGKVYNPESWIVGSLDSGKSADLPLEDSSFIDILEVEDEKNK